MGLFVAQQPIMKFPTLKFTKLFIGHVKTGECGYRQKRREIIPKVYFANLFAINTLKIYS